VEIKLDRTSPEIFDAFKAAVERACRHARMPHGRRRLRLSGQKPGLKDMEAYRKRFLSDVVLDLPGVRETHTYAVMEEIKDTHMLPLD
jgi:Lrp/AsnC family leucine-responsive transcriptional regulator